jgi:membrane fusion protein (multidrug efflux system)
MPNNQTTYATEYEIEQLKEEIKHLREERERLSQKEPQENQNGNQQKPDKNPEDHKPEEKEEKKPEDEKKEDNKPHTLRNILIIAGAIVLLAATIIYWLYSRNYESTDDAQIDAHISALSARVAGTVVGVYVEENQFVKAGQLLVDLDPRDLKAETALARSRLLEAQAQTQAEQPNVPVTQTTTQTNIATAGTDVAGAEAGVAAAQRDYDAALAKVAEAQANAAKARTDVERFRPLAQKDEIPQQQFDQVVATSKAMDATLASTQASAEAARKQVDQRQAQLNQARQRLVESQKNAPYQVAIRQANVASRQSSVEAARAQLNTAMLNESYTKIVAPVDGIIAKRSVEVGQRLSPGQQVMLITQLNDLWVTANFRETQIRRMHPGQSVRTHVDALNMDFDSYVDSMPAASGAVTSLLPPENATGNFVKVVQRLPMRIRFKPNQPGLDRLRPGMSAEPKVHLD